jgi:hypothetical protein
MRYNEINFPNELRCPICGRTIELSFVESDDNARDAYYAACCDFITVIEATNDGRGNVDTICLTYENVNGEEIVDYCNVAGDWEYTKSIEDIFGDW